MTNITVLGNSSLSVENTSSSTENSSAVYNTTCWNDFCENAEDYVDRIMRYIFPDPFEWFLIVVYTISFIIGLSGNFLVCFAVYRNQAMRTVTNYFIVNLAVADFMVILICLPPSVLESVTETWYMGSVMCKLVKYLQTTSVAVSVLTLSCISVERWYAICHPLKFKSTRTRARIMILIIWLISMSIAIPDLVVLDIQREFPESLTVLLTACRPTWSDDSQVGFQLFIFVAMYLLPLCLMFFTYFQIALCLWKNAIPTESSQQQLKKAMDGKCQAETQLQSRRKVAKMLIAVVVMFGCCYLPVHLLNILRYCGVLKNSGQAIINFALIAHWLCYFNSAINPLIYNFMSAKFRKEFRNACSCCFILCREDVPFRGRGDSSYAYKYSQSLSQTENVTLSTMNTNITHAVC